MKKRKEKIKTDDLPLDEINKESLNGETKKAVALENFLIQIPMRNFHKTVVTLVYSEGDEITDPYIISFLKNTSKKLAYY